jgi:hypothetical protein
MPDKRLLIGLGVALLILLTSIVYRLTTEDEPQDFPTMTDRQIVDIVDETEREEKADNTAVLELFSQMEDNFHRLVENVFAMGDEIVDILEDDLYEIEGKMKVVRKEVESGDFDKNETQRKLLEIQEKIVSLGQKVIEIDGE